MEDWIIGVILALFVIVPCWLALSRRKEVQRQVNAWPELAQRTGLTIITKRQKWWDPNVYPPSIRGEYRRRDLAIDLIIYGNPDRIDTLIYQNTSISLNVQNQTGSSLSIQAKGLLDDMDESTRLSSGNTDFDRHYNVTGSPREYVQRVVNSIVKCDPRLLTWIMQKFPTIELKGGNLVCLQNGELTNVDDQIALLNLLCDLAELAERMGSDNAEHDEATKFQIRFEKKLK